MFLFNTNRRVYNFENDRTEEHSIHYSRYITSWAKMYINHYKGDNLRLEYHGVYAYRGYKCMFGPEFKEWLRSLGLSEDEVHDIYEMATNGKMELEASADRFIDNL